MNEVTKLYENAGIEKEFEKPAKCAKNPYITRDGCMLYDDKKGRCNNKKYYPLFTPEKQLEIVKFMLHKGIYYDTDGDAYWFHYTDEIENATYRPFEEAIAEFINGFWQFLTEKERKQIKNILESEVRE